MGVIPYKHKLSSGDFETRYMVVVEAINKFTGRRIQKKRRGILSRPKAERLLRELWVTCREERPDHVGYSHWGSLISHYIEYVINRQRSASNPNGFSPQVVRSKQSRLRHTDPWSAQHLELVTPQFVTERLDELEKSGMSRSLTNHVLKEVKCVFSFALFTGAIKVNPFSGFKLRKEPKRRKEAFTHEEVKKLLSEAKLRNHPYYLIWLLSTSLGLRRSELAGLKWVDLDFDQGLAYLQRQYIPGEGMVDSLKDGEDRVVAIPEQLITVLKEMKLKSSSDFVIDLKCKTWTGGRQAEVLRKFCREIGIKELTHHQLRATHITLALIDGVPLGIVKENVGHAKLSTTDLYFRSAGINMRGQMDRLQISVPQDETGAILTFERCGSKNE